MADAVTLPSKSNASPRACASDHWRMENYRHGWCRNWFPNRLFSYLGLELEWYMAIRHPLDIRILFKKCILFVCFFVSFNVSSTLPASFKVLIITVRRVQLHNMQLQYPL